MIAVHVLCERVMMFMCNDDSVNLLGVIVQPHVKWNVHIDAICKKVAKGILCLENLSRL